jgi:Na+/phosphate symporter
VDEIKAVSWCWSLSRLRIASCLFYECCWNPWECMRQRWRLLLGEACFGVVGRCLAAALAGCADSQFWGAKALIFGFQCVLIFLLCTVAAVSILVAFGWYRVPLNFPVMVVLCLCCICLPFAQLVLGYLMNMLFQRKSGTHYVRLHFLDSILSKLKWITTFESYVMN